MQTPSTSGEGLPVGRKRPATDSSGVVRAQVGDRLALLSQYDFLHAYWKTTGDASCFMPIGDKRASASCRLSRAAAKKDAGPHSFKRTTDNPIDTLPFEVGNPTRSVGLIHSGFRPSDDACIYRFSSLEFLCGGCVKSLADIFFGGTLR